MNLFTSQLSMYARSMQGMAAYVETPHAEYFLSSASPVRAITVSILFRWLSGMALAAVSAANLTIRRT